MLRIVYVFLRNVVVNLVLLLPNLARLVVRRRPPPAFLRVELRGALPARRPPRPPLPWRLFGERGPALSEEELWQALARARDAAWVRGVLLVLREPRLGFGQLVALRGELAALRGAGKEVVVHFEHAGNGTYYLASVGTYVAMARAGSVDLTGLAAEVRFYKGLLDRLSADADVVAMGRYKNAFDPFARDAMSDAQREATEALLDDASAEIVRGLAERPGFDLARARAAIDGGPYTGPRALEAGLVDDLVYGDELAAKLALPPAERPRAVTAAPSAAAHPPKPPAARTRARPDEARFVSPAGLAARTRPAWRWTPLRRPRGIAYVPVFGTIHSGESRRSPLGGGESAGDQTVRAALAAARKDRRVKAVVLHVDSRGGSGLASDLMWREVRLLRAEKPVVAYLGDYAASGGYYVAVGADTVFASPGTITGSIGVIAAKVSVGRLLARLGVNTEVLKRGAHADLYSPSRTFTDEEREALRRDLAAFYEDFVAKVAACRGLLPDEVAPHAQGRVWSGVRAKSLGLVDALGSLRDALDEAKARGGFARGADVPVLTLGRAPMRAPRFLGGAAAAGVQALEAAIAAAPALAAELGPLVEAARLEGEGALALWPFTVDLR